MTDPILLSRRIWASLLVLAGTFGGFLGIQWSEGVASALSENFELVLTGIGGALAILSKVREIRRSSVE